ncbi:hypothetical protein [Anabaenopsis arnoldii]|uniref:Uncharacterized protein n=1 Tax=Anabaenopsis arnoldii TaxID=2152938 RepID=A0ABT5AS62_9CYAN|nr:hypothetical protein [Anabaenopsis arnoldii]MDB9540131.1 hypothetical protein [Anabaenopsis arnoldii]MDH6092525.1 hypothetical protein [Anabaenopsis arnoldii]
MGWASSHRGTIAVPITVVEGNIKGRSWFRLRSTTEISSLSVVEGNIKGAIAVPITVVEGNIKDNLRSHQRSRREHQGAIAVPISVVEGNIKGRSRFRLPSTTNINLFPPA